MFDEFELTTIETGEASIRVGTLDCGHYLAEEAPDAAAAELMAFLRNV